MIGHLHSNLDTDALTRTGTIDQVTLVKSINKKKKS